jgi:hypothetical protein
MPVNPEQGPSGCSWSSKKEMAQCAHDRGISAPPRAWPSQVPTQGWLTGQAGSRLGAGQDAQMQRRRDPPLIAGMGKGSDFVWKVRRAAEGHTRRSAASRAHWKLRRKDLVALSSQTGTCTPHHSALLKHKKSTRACLLHQTTRPNTLSAPETWESSKYDFFKAVSSRHVACVLGSTGLHVINAWRSP